MGMRTIRWRSGATDSGQIPCLPMLGLRQCALSPFPACCYRQSLLAITDLQHGAACRCAEMRYASRGDRCSSLQGAGAGDLRPHPLLLPWQPSCRRQEAPTAGKVAQPRSACALPRPPTGPLLPPPQAPVAAQDFPAGKSWWLGGSRPHPGRAGAAAWQAPSRCARGRRQYLHRATM